MAGPLAGLKVIEMAGIGPAPFCGMMLADMGADVIRVDRPEQASAASGERKRYDVLGRGRRSIAVDLKKAGSADMLLDLVEKADVLIEGFRPGVMERLGLGPDACLGRNAALVYGRMTGWGQDGPLSHAAGHDINYIAISGALHAIGRPGEPPVVPLNYIGDFGGGGMLLAFGVMCAVHEARRSGKGQVVDAAMTDGAALLSAMMYGFHADGSMSSQRGESLLDGGAHFYNTYACADGKHVAVGAIEPQFYALLLEKCGIDDPAFRAQRDVHGWPILKNRLADLFRTRTRAEWCALMEGSDACFAPVLDWDEAPAHPHNRSRATFMEIDGVVQPAPAPRFSRTPPDAPPARGDAAGNAAETLLAWGVDRLAIDRMRENGMQA
ncbi:CaiB/BaiF CoA transferase family protein [Noviherbaspirillum galbum]|uniref:CoA transferase n=1 Tax=Noviherbaspirillum galbum TaxID=2709383 RepID=A0A6B3SP30_9BURK|nr:CaiB/BaiF CoA-transferase family protein [Noviherbaspirillum galbum]NEX59469.1 CoA transferase [Noviherbaspirillum galbum]